MNVFTREDPQVSSWRRMNVVDGRQLWKRWSATAAGDSLVSAVADGEHQRELVWPVSSEYDLVRLLGALQYVNRRCTLWFRGEPEYFEFALPERCRNDPGGGKIESFKNALAWFDRVSTTSRLLRDRTPLARLAILQHYGGETSFLDVTRDYRVALFFAFHVMIGFEQGKPVTSPGMNPHISVFASPRITDSVNDFPALGFSVVDLRAEVPSYCLRPHMQHAGFIGLRQAIQEDLKCQESETKSNLDDLRIARIKLIDFKPHVEMPAELVFPPAARSCKLCARGTRKRPDWRYDSVLHLLRCVQTNGFPLEPALGIPDCYWDIQG